MYWYIAIVEGCLNMLRLVHPLYLLRNSWLSLFSLRSIYLARCPERNAAIQYIVYRGRNQSLHHTRCCYVVGSSAYYIRVITLLKNLSGCFEIIDCLGSHQYCAGTNCFLRMGVSMPKDTIVNGLRINKYRLHKRFISNGRSLSSRVGLSYSIYII